MSREALEAALLTALTTLTNDEGNLARLAVVYPDGGVNLAQEAGLAAILADAVLALSSPETTPAPDAELDVERLARALNESVGTLGWLHLTPPNAVDEWRENARIIAIEYARLALPQPGEPT